jgi:hypothetical protein
VVAADQAGGQARPLTRFSSAFSAVCRKKHRDACDDADSAYDCPFRRSSHEAAGQDADALKEPYAADDDKQNCDNIRQDSHTYLDKLFR